MRHDDVAARLLLAVRQGDELALASVLSPEVDLFIDSGDGTGGEQRGRARVIRVLVERLARQADVAIELAHVNGGPGLALRRRDGRVIAVLCFDAGGDPAGASGSGPVVRLWLTTAPGKLEHWNGTHPHVT